MSRPPRTSHLRSGIRYRARTSFFQRQARNRSNSQSCRKEVRSVIHIVLFTAVLLGAAPGETFFWHSSYADAISEVRRTDKPLFLLFDGGPSSAVQVVGGSPVLSNETEKALASDYVRMYVDTGNESGRALAARFGASEMPLTVVIDRSGDWQMYRRSGVPTTAELLGVLSQFRRVKYSAPTPAARADQTESGSNGSANAATVRSANSAPVRTETRYYAPVTPSFGGAWCST